MNQPTTTADAGESESEQQSLEQQLNRLSGWMLVGFLASGLCCYWGFQSVNKQDELAVSSLQIAPESIPPLPEVEPQAPPEELVAIDDWLGLKPKRAANDAEPDDDSSSIDPGDLASDSKSQTPPKPAKLEAAEASEDRDEARLAQLPEPPQSASESNPEPATVSRPDIPRPPPLENYMPAADLPEVITELTWDPIQPFESQPNGNGQQFQLPTEQTGSPLPVPHPTQTQLNNPAPAQISGATDRFMIQPPAAGIGAAKSPAHEEHRDPAGSAAASVYPSTGMNNVFEQRSGKGPVNFQPRPPRRPAIYQASGSPLNR